ncbi:MAG: DUF3090 family protein [Chloroflexi bacterium]|nr:DUF3090 family protein [Chloroflexota bacterium]
MDSKPYQFKPVTQLIAGAIGVPGKRTFYLLVGRKGTLVRLWLAKEQLQGLAVSILQLLARLSPRYFETPSEEAEPIAPSTPPSEPIADEFKVGELALAYDEEHHRLALMAHDIEEQESSPPALYCQATPEQMWSLTRQIAAVCAAGRPICPICGGPIDPEGHPCPKKNGHRAFRLQDTERADQP